jgi:hypothetical protein
MLGVQTKKTADVQRFNNHRGPGGSLSNLFIKYHNLSNIRLLNSYI